MTLVEALKLVPENAVWIIKEGIYTLFPYKLEISDYSVIFRLDKSLDHEYELNHIVTLTDEGISLGCMPNVEVVIIPPPHVPFNLKAELIRELIRKNL